MNEQELEFWRAVLRGEAGFNGQPQAVVRLMEVSDATRLERVRLGFPEAVAAFEETRA